MKDRDLIVMLYPANGQSVISKITEAKGHSCRSSEDQFAGEGE